MQLLGPSTGGIRRYVAFLTAELQRRQWTVEVAGPSGVMDGLGPLNHVVAVPAGPQPLAVPRALRQLRSLLPRYDVVNAHGLTAGWLAVLSRRRRRGPKLVVTVHNLVLDEVAGRRAGMLRQLERRLPPRVDDVIAVSPEIAAHIGSGNVTTIGALGPPPRPARSREAVRAALGVGRGDPLIVAVARLHPQKGLDVLLDAMPHVAECSPAARLVVVGEGPLEAELHDQARRLGVTDRVTFAPPVNPADEMAAADVVVIPSRWESGPLVLTEALALGRPVVATPVGMVTDVVAHGETGWLVPVGDHTALADALVEAITDPDEARRRAAAAQLGAAAVLDVDGRVALVEAVYRASLGRR